MDEIKSIIATLEENEKICKVTEWDKGYLAGLKRVIKVLDENK